MKLPSLGLSKRKTLLSRTVALNRSITVLSHLDTSLLSQTQKRKVSKKISYLKVKYTVLNSAFERSRTLETLTKGVF